MRNQFLITGFAAVCIATAPLEAEAYTMEDAKAGAHLRSEASVVVSLLFFPCHRSAAMEAPLARYEAFKAGLQKDQHRIDLAIAEGDLEYQMSLVDIACPDPDAPETAQMDEINASVVNDAMDRMDAIVAAAANDAVTENREN